jgi:hypothetical protein
MKAATGTLILSALVLAGCRATQDVAETSYHVATAPVRIAHRAIAGDEDSHPVAPDVTNPGRPVPATSSTSSRQEVSSSRQEVSDSRSSPRSEEAPKPRTSPRPARSGDTQAQFPTAKPVPGRAGLVYNPYDPNGGYIDVSGYAPGSKVKDPDSQKIFIVP